MGAIPVPNVPKRAGGVTPGSREPKLHKRAPKEPGNQSSLGSKAQSPAREVEDEVEILDLSAFNATVIREEVILGYQERHDTRRLFVAAGLFSSLVVVLLFGMLTDLGIEATLAYAAPISALAGAAAQYLFRHGGDVHDSRRRS
jgi:hypothetical protein